MLASGERTRFQSLIVDLEPRRGAFAIAGISGSTSSSMGYGGSQSGSSSPLTSPPRSSTWSQVIDGASLFLYCNRLPRAAASLWKTLSDSSMTIQLRVIPTKFDLILDSGGLRFPRGHGVEDGDFVILQRGSQLRTGRRSSRVQAPSPIRILNARHTTYSR